MMRSALLPAFLSCSTQRANSLSRLNTSSEGPGDDVVAAVIDESVILVEHGELVLVELHRDLLLGSFNSLGNE